jgi:CRP-like cAMP-binding protein
MQNQLLMRLSPADVALLGIPIEVELALRDQVETRGEPGRYVYFFEAGIASTVASFDGKMAEIGLVGLDGFIGSGVLDGDEHIIFDTWMQVAGRAQRYDMAEVRHAVSTSPAISSLLHRAVKATGIQMAETIWANGHSLLEERLARWLLMLADRLGTRFQITHDFVSVMLAVRRSGVTIAMQNIEGRGLIKNTRGQVEIRDRDGLVKLAGASYGFADAEQRRLLGGVPMVRSGALAGS